MLVDSGKGSSWLSIHLSVIRTVFDKMCGRSVTLGLQTPRRPKRIPVVLSVQEITRLLMAAVSLRDKLLIGLLYALGARVSEVVRLRYRDFDFDRACVTIWQGKGRTDRQVTLSASFEPLLRELAKTDSADAYIFHSDRPDTCRADGHCGSRGATRLVDAGRSAFGTLGRTDAMAHTPAENADRVSGVLRVDATRGRPPFSATLGEISRGVDHLPGLHRCVRTAVAVRARRGFRAQDSPSLLVRSTSSPPLDLHLSDKPDRISRVH